MFVNSMVFIKLSTGTSCWFNILITRSKRNKMSFIVHGSAVLKGTSNRLFLASISSTFRTSIRGQTSGFTARNLSPRLLSPPLDGPSTPACKLHGAKSLAGLQAKAQRFWCASQPPLIIDILYMPHKFMVWILLLYTYATHETKLKIIVSNFELGRYDLFLWESSHIVCFKLAMRKAWVFHSLCAWR